MKLSTTRLDREHRSFSRGSSSRAPALLLMSLLGGAMSVSGCAMQEDTSAAIADLGNGDRGASVEKAYRYLERYGYLGDAKLPMEPQVFDGVLEQSLTRFQEIHRLPVDGTLNQETLALMAEPRCGAPDHELVRRHMAGGPSTSFSFVGEKWAGRNIYYHQVSYSPDMPFLDQSDVLWDATERWQAANPVIAIWESAQPGPIDISFGGIDHGDGRPFLTGEVAHHFPPGPGTGGDIHFNELVQWHVGDLGEVSYAWALMHNLGHALGISHSNVAGSIMRPGLSNQVTLGSDDVTAIRTLYPPLAPTPLRVFSTACYGENWVDWISQRGATHYELYRSSSPSFSSQALLYSGTEFNIFVEVPSGGASWLRVRACNGAFCGDYSNIEGATYYNGCQ